MNESADPRAKAQGRDELPPLPIGELMGSATINGARIELYRYTEQHMRDYARLALSQREEGLREALERSTWNFRLLLAGKPVRDVAETLAECDRALSPSPIEKGTT